MSSRDATSEDHKAQVARVAEQAAVAGVNESKEHRGWTFTARRTRISTTDEIDELESAIPALRSPPEMLFGLNEVKMVHAASGVTISFNARDAFKKLPDNAEGPWGVESEFRDSGLTSADETSSPAAAPASAGSSTKAPFEHLSPLVAHAADWKKDKAKDVDAHEVFDFDWTFCTRYTGTVRKEENAGDGAAVGAVVADGSVGGVSYEHTTEQINVELLTRPDPILFFHETIFFEDELADSGTAQLSAKMRVMPSCFLVLLRFFLRVDKVLYRSCETRYYHEFGTDFVLREVTVREHEAAALEAKLKRQREREARQQGGSQRHQTRGHADPNEIIPQMRPKLVFSEAIKLQ